MNEKPWYEKIYIWIGIIAGICTVLGFVFSLLSTSNTTVKNNGTMNNNSKLDNSFNIEGNNNIIIHGDNNGDINMNTGTSSEPTPSPKTEILESKVTPQFNFGEAMQNIYDNEKIINNEIINKQEVKPVYSSIYLGVSYYHISNEVRIIEVTNGFRDIECSRTYYFDENGKLSFSLICDNKGEHRLYFCDDILIRYKDINGEDYDINHGLENFECEWTKLTLEESYEIFNGVKKTSDSDIFSVVASYDMDTVQSSIKGIDVLIRAETTFPADRVIISAISDEVKTTPADMHGGTCEWYFKANFYVKGTYIVTVTAYNSDGERVSDEFIYVY